jgi:hypothetical protein
MKNVFSKTMLVALAVVMVTAIGTTSMAVAANGKPFILGQNNVATAITKLVKKGAATATDPSGNTSEFSAPRRVANR